MGFIITGVIVFLFVYYHSPEKQQKEDRDYADRIFFGVDRG